jgi:hypothetical protein
MIFREFAEVCYCQLAGRYVLVDRLRQEFTCSKVQLTPWHGCWPKTYA